MSEENRLENIEVALSHVQHDLESISKSLDAILRRLNDLETRFQQIEQHAFAPRDEPEAIDSEKPPHY